MTFKLGEQITGHLAHDVHKHIQATTVRHTDNDFLDTRFTGMVHKLVHRSDKALASLERKALLSDVFCMEITLKAFGLGQLLQNMFFAVRIDGRRTQGGLQALLYPTFHGRVRGMHEFCTN